MWMLPVREGHMRRLTSLMACGLAWMLLLTVSPEVRAQQFTGGLRGAVKDAAGVIPGVAVTLVNEETTAARNTVSNEAGEYLFSAVNPGTRSEERRVGKE